MLALALDLTALPAPVQRVLAPQTPAALRQMASKAVVPGLKPEFVVTVVALLAEGEVEHVEPQVRAQAKETLASLPPPLAAAALTSEILEPAILDVVARYNLKNQAVLEILVSHPKLAMETVVHLATHGDDWLTELVAVNEAKLLTAPHVIEALYMNRHTRMSTADRLVDLAVRNGLVLNIPSFREAAAALEGELIAMPEEEPTFDDVLFRETEQIGRELDEDLLAKGEKPADLIEEHEVERDAKEAVGPESPASSPSIDLKVKEKAQPLDQRLRQMNAAHKIRMATLGPASARTLLIRDKNKQVAAAVVRSPLVQEQEIVAFSSSRAVSDDVLRIIGNSEFTRVHQIKVNLVNNPKTPLATALKHLIFLHPHELKRLASSKGVSGQVTKLAKQELAKKQKGGG